jgi:hypothetical protein
MGALPDIWNKTAHYWTSNLDDSHPAWASVERAVAAGELCGKPVMVDFVRTPQQPYPDLCSETSAGRYHTTYLRRFDPLIVKESQRFSLRPPQRAFRPGPRAGGLFRNAAPAIRDGFPPDTISTDLHMGNINGPVISMLNTMSKCLCMGMPLEEVIQRSTSQPAQLNVKSSYQDLLTAIDWAVAQNSDPAGPYFRRIDTTAIAASGYSCGGAQAMRVAADPRVKTLVMMNSGLFKDGESATIPEMDVRKAALQALHTPALYVIGGETDVAYANSQDDFRRIDTPYSWPTSMGHGGTYWEPNGGGSAAVVVAWPDGAARRPRARPSPAPTAVVPQPGLVGRRSAPLRSGRSKRALRERKHINFPRRCLS